MNKQTNVAAKHDDTINRVLQANHIKDGGMIDYLESRLHYIQCSESDLRHELTLPISKTAEPGFYEKLFAELAAERQVVEAIIEKLKEVLYNEEMIKGVQKRLANIREGMKEGV